MRASLIASVVFCSSLLVSWSPICGEDWPAWRGPRSDGTSLDTGVPLTWSREQNVKWKTPLPEPGNSTPIILGDRIFLTQSLEQGQKRAILCFQKSDGSQLWKAEFPGKPEATHPTNPLASSSPITDGEAVYAWFGSAGVVAVDLEGKTLWTKDLGTFTHIWGYGSSPVVHGNLLIINCGPGERAFVIALDKKSGKEVWKVDGVTGKAEDFLGSWSSPKIARENGKDVLLVGHPRQLVAYDPAKGSELWKCAGLTDLVYSTPIVSEGVAVAMSGYHGKALAVRLGGTGDVTNTHRLWNTRDGAKELQRIGSGIILDGYIYMVNEPGVECIKLATGESAWRKRLGHKNWSSLVLAEGRLYFVDQNGTTHVFAAKPEFESLATNALEETTNGSIAIADGDVFIRTYQHLWCIGD